MGLWPRAKSFPCRALSIDNTSSRKTYNHDVVNLFLRLKMSESEVLRRSQRMWLHLASPRVAPSYATHASAIEKRHKTVCHTTIERANKQSVSLREYTHSSV